MRLLSEALLWAVKLICTDSGIFESTGSCLINGKGLSFTLVLPLPGRWHIKTTSSVLLPKSNLAFFFDLTIGLSLRQSENDDANIF